MRYSQYFIPTVKETPSDAEVVSHKLMLRAGMIRKLAAGIYNYLPLGLRSIRKVEQIVREEMNRAGAIELLMPSVQPAELWQESKRWEQYGKELLRFKDRKDAEFCLGPTHEEVITDLVRREVKSYRQLPLNLYQVQSKFRDEIRPRFGLMRGREFIMKDAYSFDVSSEAADTSYDKMYQAYRRIFQRCGLKFRAVEADTGSIGGSSSHEFMVLADSGEDAIVSCTACEYAANVEKAEARLFPSEHAEPRELEKVETPQKRSVEEVTTFLGIPASSLVKTLLCVADGEPVAALVRGDHDLNEIKLKHLLGCEELEMASEEIVERVTGAPVGFAGPVGLKIKIVADLTIQGMKNFVTGGNARDLHFKNVNIGRDFTPALIADIRNVVHGDPCPRCEAGHLEMWRGIEVGHVFKLGTKYSESLRATFLDADGKEQVIFMGCYGIGISRTVAACIEQNHDADGIIFPIPIAPFHCIISAVSTKDAEVVAACDELYRALTAVGVEVLFDDRDERPGSKFKDADLIGIPLRIVVGSKNLAEGKVELKSRKGGEVSLLPLAEAVETVKGLVVAALNQ
ncbi:prolyl-tRNA synthetase [Geobacter metallireducens GS-15]|uniref:Proline--tRNA ligase n=1 Tax=Geobacter metallireducens (strain ATCC 53774 / DSM 7210 / GS-15) TaxID=269799 RepID=SYP_GEOMG|nr:proline--tRNA ligase [Geobacter metallireducens]Q39VY6.1 RecName: Full=Proline--tRNA ligase; AltName: Full=Prolyl-tRNA synthetase; Short=ProRS [Geobacter metallireducens GS-15]ABB31588.1 prolyl-tRNA synthetase [Geobacter metallireducens GS-15]